MIKIGSIAEAYQAFLSVPELDGYLSAEEFSAKVPEDALILIFEIEDELAGFKIGYPIDNDEFYSWLGGVLPCFRNNGIAQKLLDYQESWVVDKKFMRTSVKSMNRYPAMICLLVRNGYKVVKIDDFDKEEERIIFLKTFNETSL